MWSKERDDIKLLVTFIRFILSDILMPLWEKDMKVVKSSWQIASAGFGTNHFDTRLNRAYIII